MVVPEVVLVTADGHTLVRGSGTRGEETLTYRLKDASVKQDYDRIRIRADQEVRLEAIYWTGIIIRNIP